MHQKNGKPYISEYQDENTDDWLKGDNPRSRYYNHLAFCDLVISGLVGLCPKSDQTIVVHPLIPANTWKWFALDNVYYRGKVVTILWDQTGEKYKKGWGLSVYVACPEHGRGNDKLTAHSSSIERIEVSL